MTRKFLPYVLCWLLIPGSLLADLRVMTLNTEWLWTPFDQRADGSKSLRRDMSKADYLREIRFYAGLVKDNRVDILAVSEIENEYVAKDLARAIGKNWQAYFRQGRDTATGQDVAILSHLDAVKGSVTTFGFPCAQASKARKKKCLSKVLGVHLHDPSTPGRTIAVLTSHFLSKRNNSKAKTLKRESQALALLKSIRRSENSLAKDADIHLIALGDFNDTSQSNTLKILTKGAGLTNSLACSSHGNKKSNQARIDHILFKGFACHQDMAISSGKFSDHKAIMAVLK